MKNALTIGSYPGGSRARVTKAGENVRNGVETSSDLAVIEQWRAAHRDVINTFQSILRKRIANVTVAQRHKRRNTIFNKLKRFPTMKLARMDDVAGCRVIFENEADLHRFRNELHKARFQHKLRHSKDKYDYIQNPKPSGYRGIHDVYEYRVNSEAGKALRGLYCEIQYRTYVQHAWATAVEIVGLVTQNQPKFDAGDHRYREAMTLASEILARAHENRYGPLPTLTNKDVLERFIELDMELGLMSLLRGLNKNKSAFSEKKNRILIFDPSGELTVRSYRDATEAIRELFALERDFPKNDIVLVRAESSDEVRIAFRNYFKDASEFIELIEKGCAKLSGKSLQPPP